MPRPDFARIAYEAYAHDLALHGQMIQRWEHVQQHIKDAWHMAVIVVIDAYDAHIRAEGEAAWQKSQSS